MGDRDADLASRVVLGVLLFLLAAIVLAAIYDYLWR